MRGASVTIHSSRPGLFRAAAGVLLSGSFALSPLASFAQSGAQTGADAARPTRSLADSLRSGAGKQHHIFYVHGIASDGPGDYDSWNLRRAICDFVGDCTSPAGELDAKQREYADQDEFSLTAEPPKLEYLGERVWKTSKEWSAAAPYVVHWKLARSTGPAIYVDEINWWPLVFSLKCRQIVRSDAELVGPDVDRIKVCSTLRPDPKAPDRFLSYDWIPDEDARVLLKQAPKAALVNRKLKNGILDWGFSDAVLALGPLRPYLLDGVRQLILKSVAIDGSGRARSTDQEYVIVSHSLGSYLIFAALDINRATPKTQTVQQAGDAFEQILARTSLVYFFANQLRLLELANLDGSSDNNLVSHLEAWGRLRCDYLKSQAGSAATCAPPQIVALNDPSDLLTWTVPDLSSVKVNNVIVKNATHWFGLFESPTKAHDNYAKNKNAIGHMLKLGPRDAETEAPKVASGYR
jgi:hypothetical protein